MFWNNQHRNLSWFLPSSKSQMIHTVDAFYEEALFPTLGDWKSCCGIHSSTGLTLMATEHAGVKFHSSPSLPPSNAPPPASLLCSTLCVCCSCDSAESPRCNFLFALSWTETHQRSAERGESALLTGSLPHLSQFLLHLRALLLLAVLARSGRQVVLLWLQFGHTILTRWTASLTQGGVCSVYWDVLKVKIKRITSRRRIKLTHFKGMCEETNLIAKWTKKIQGGTSGNATRVVTSCPLYCNHVSLGPKKRQESRWKSESGCPSVAVNICSSLHYNAPLPC